MTVVENCREPGDPYSGPNSSTSSLFTLGNNISPVDFSRRWYNSVVLMPVCKSPPNHVASVRLFHLLALPFLDDYLNPVNPDHLLRGAGFIHPRGCCEEGTEYIWKVWAHYKGQAFRNLPKTQQQIKEFKILFIPHAVYTSMHCRKVRDKGNILGRIWSVWSSAQIL